MASYKAFVISGLLLMTITIVIQSAPIKKPKTIVHLFSTNNKHGFKQPLKSDDPEKSSSSSTGTTTMSTTTVSQSSLSASKITQEKKKRYIDDDQLDGVFDDEVDINQLPYVKFNDHTNHILHAKIQETSAKTHDNADKPVDTDDSKVFSDIKMTPNELINVVRRRREIKLHDQSNQRRKRALSPYDFYDTDSFYDPYADLIERHEYARPIRSFAPIYWYPSAYDRPIRSSFEPSFYESSEWPELYSNIIDDDDDNEIDENPVLIFDDENDYESNRYPILLQSSDNPFDNLQLQQQYNADDLPIDEEFEQNLKNDDDNDDDDDDEEYDLFYRKERPYYTIRYEPIET